MRLYEITAQTEDTITLRKTGETFKNRAQFRLFSKRPENAPNYTGKNWAVVPDNAIPDKPITVVALPPVVQYRCM